MAPKAWLEYSLIKSARAWISDFGSKMNPTLESCIVSTVICKSQRLDKYRNLRKHGVYISLKQIELLNTFWYTDYMNEESKRLCKHRTHLSGLIFHTPESPTRTLWEVQSRPSTKAGPLNYQGKFQLKSDNVLQINICCRKRKYRTTKHEKRSFLLERNKLRVVIHPMKRSWE